jgi:protocatechuate 3,4-dioxygenase beta subunit
MYLLLLLLPVQRMAALGQPDSTCLRDLSCRLERMAGSVSEILTDPNFLELHPNPAFRELIRRYARPEPIRIISGEESGQHIRICGWLTNRYRQPVSNALVYIYQRDDRGFFAADQEHWGSNEDDRRQARLFGYCRTDEHGYFEIYTVRPRCAPGANNPAALFLELETPGGKTISTRLYFDDDALLSDSLRKSIRKNGFHVAPRKGGRQVPQYEYHLQSE